jgi:hypothetical protein
VGGGGSGVGGALWLRWEGGCGGRVGGRPYIGRVRGGGSGPVWDSGQAGEDGPASPIRLCREESSRQRKLYSY